MNSTIRGQYEVQQEIGSGGMGKVFQALDLKLNRKVAIKALQAGSKSDDERRRRFIVEAQSASALNHPNIVTIFDILDEDGTDYMVMEYLPGKTLLELIPRGGLRFPLVIDYGLQIVDGLVAAHAAGIVHRDLKPGNIIVSERGFVKILDFGLAKLTDTGDVQDTDATTDAPLTVQGAIMGTLSYMSPEQAQGKKVDARSDIFSLGAVLYEMATGQRAFAGDSPAMILTSVLRDEPKSLAELAPDIPYELDRAIWKCLRKDPQERWQRMDELHRAFLNLRAGSESGVLYRPVPPPQPIPAPPAPSSKRMQYGIAAISILAAGWFWSPGRAPRKPEKAPATVQESPARDLLTNENIIDLVDAKVSESLIFNQIRASKTRFDLSPDAVIELVRAGVPERIIEAMRDPAKIPSAMAARSSPMPPLPSAPAPSIAVAYPLTIPDGTPIQLALLAGIASNASTGAELKFEVSADVAIDGKVVVRKGAPARGVIAERGKRKLFGGGKTLFRVTDLISSSGKALRIRANSKAKEDGPRALDGQTEKGAVFVAYIDGAQETIVKEQ